MSKGDNTPGISNLAGILKEMAKAQVPTDLVLDFGTIQGDGSLLTNTYPEPIPKSDYLICDNNRRYRDTWDYTVRQKISRGDRVLVAWVQNDPVVIDRILDADSVL